jgi:hypothetical protein
VLFEKRFWSGIADGTITLTFRRWKRIQVVAGRSYRTAGGIINVTSIKVVEAASITRVDAHSAGYDSEADLIDKLRGGPEQPIYRIQFVRSTQPDLRAELAARVDLSGDDIANVSRRLERLDRASRHGPWTRATLDLIAEFHSAAPVISPR